MPGQIDEMLQRIDARLEELERERLHLLELRSIYAPIDGTPAPARTTSAPPPSRQMYLFPPVPDSEKVKLVRDANNKTGITPVILHVASKYPGLDISQLTTRVLDHVITDDPKVNRANVRAMLNYLAETARKLVKRDGKFYVVEQSG